MDITSTEFVGSYPALGQMPQEPVPQVAFIGRSNVGKSSLINALLGVRGLAKTSSTPGKTQMINLFRISGKLFFVDLPGYGFAKVPKRELQRWQQMIEEYLLGSDQLRLLVLLIDARHGLMKSDIQMAEFLAYNQLPWLPVLTKIDKLKQKQRARMKREIADPEHLLHGAATCSAKTRAGIKEIWGAIDTVIR